MLPDAGALVARMPVDMPVRRRAVARFPYHVIYLHIEDQIRILAPAEPNTFEYYFAFHLFVSIVCLAYSVFKVRWHALRSAARTRRVLRSRDENQPASTRPVHPLTVKNNPAIGNHPLIWKERYLGRTFGGFAFGSTLWLVFNLIFCVFLIIAFIIGIHDWQQFTQGMPMRVVLVKSKIVPLTASSLPVGISVLSTGTYSLASSFSS